MINSLEVESAVVGGLLVDPGAYPRIQGRIRVGDFAHDHCAQIFEAIEALLAAGKPADVITVSQSVKVGLAVVGELANESPGAANIVTYAELVRDYAQRRQIFKLTKDIAANIETDTAEALAAQLYTGIEAIRAHTIGEAKNFADIVRAAARTIVDAAERREKGGIVGVPTGIPCLDARTGGFLPGRMYGIAARPGVGKTALLNQVAIHAGQKGHPGLIMSLEMSDDELGIRALASVIGLNATKLSMGIEDECALVAPGITQHNLMQLPIWIDTSTYSLDAIEGRIAEAKRKHEIKWAAVDHIGLVETSSFNTRNDQVGLVTRSLKKLAKRLDIAMIAVSQLNRGNERESRKPRLSDLRDSGNIEQDLDVAIFLHQDQEKEGDEIHIGLLKNRGGRKGWLEEQVRFEGRTQRFLQIDERHQEEPACRTHWTD